MPHFIFLRALRIRSVVTGVGGPSTGATSGSRSLSHSERQFTSVISFTFLANNILICCVHLLGKFEDPSVVRCDIREYFSLSHRLGLPDHMLCQTFHLVVGRFRIFCLPRLTGLSQGYVPLETFSYLLDCFFNLVIPPTSFPFPLMLL